MAELANCLGLFTLSVLENDVAQVFQVDQAEADLRVCERLRTNAIAFQLTQLLD